MKVVTGCNWLFEQIVSSLLMPFSCGEHAFDGAVGSINVSNILSGKCLAKISADDPSVGIRPRARANSSIIRSTVQEALEDVTALFYDEERNEIYTGTDMD